jgi:hypothetical protein
MPPTFQYVANILGPDKIPVVIELKDENIFPISGQKKSARPRIKVSCAIPFAQTKFPVASYFAM